MLLFNLQCTLIVTQSTHMSVYVTIILLAHLAHTQWYISASAGNNLLSRDSFEDSSAG